MSANGQQHIDRASRHRIEHADRKEPGKGTEATPDPKLILHKPQHWHVDLVIYSSKVETTGQRMNESHYHNLVTNDVQLAVTRAKAVARMVSGPTRSECDVEQVVQCSDHGPQGEELHHLDGTEFA